MTPFLERALYYLNSSWKASTTFQRNNTDTYKKDKKEWEHFTFLSCQHSWIHESEQPCWNFCSPQIWVSQLQTGALIPWFQHYWPVHHGCLSGHSRLGSRWSGHYRATCVSQVPREAYMHALNYWLRYAWQHQECSLFRSTCTCRSLVKVSTTVNCDFTEIWLLHKSCLYIIICYFSILFGQKWVGTGKHGVYLQIVELAHFTNHTF